MELYLTKYVSYQVSMNKFTVIVKEILQYVLSLCDWF